MTRYWIVVDKAHEGPFTIEELAEKNLSGDTYAWYPGLPKWTKIKDIPELSPIVAEQPSEAETPEVPATANQDEAVRENVATESQPSRPVAPPPPPVPSQPLQTVSAVEAEAPVTVDSANEKRPPSYLAWAIVTTIIFFLPLGIVALIYSSKVNSLWLTGQREKARKSSEMAAWFSNIAFVAGLIWFPFSMAFALII